MKTHSPKLVSFPCSLWRLIWVYAVCIGLSVPIFRFFKFLICASFVYISNEKRLYKMSLFFPTIRGWSGVAMVSCILRHRGVQLKLAYSWARPAILVAGKGRGGMFLFLLFLHFHSCSYFSPNRLFHLLHNLFSPFLWETTQNDTQGLTCR